MSLSFEEALEKVREKLSGVARVPPSESVGLPSALGRFLAEDVAADRDYPPFHRAIRDGFAVRSSDVVGVPVGLVRQGEVRAGAHFSATVGVGECVEIMTGAPLPPGADAVVMIEHVRVTGSQVEVLRSIGPWENVVRKGSEAAVGSVVLRRGRRVMSGEIGLLASVGRDPVRVFRQPEVAILPTGDEVVPHEQKPQWFQIRNSNALTLAAQVRAAGGRPRPMPIAPDDEESLRRSVREGLESDLLLLSGGVSMGKYDFVRKILSELGAESFIQGVAIRPGKPLVFGRVAEKFFFGLPGNPVSTYVTFELFVRPALAMLSGGEFLRPVFLRARLGKPFRQKHGLTAFMPARVETRDGDPVVELVGWQGSGDLVGVAAANCFLVVHPEQMELAAGAWVDVLPRPG
ncbi:MAG: molybdopterin molybdotransferase MoeA [Acidobacteriia bacterium]|nr:molybdopterin molybdotransferase MoeA [Terriglobia bacterium]